MDDNERKEILMQISLLVVEEEKEFQDCAQKYISYLFMTCIIIIDNFSIVKDP